MMSPGLRKFTLTAHVTSSVGWLGAVGTFLMLGIVGLSSRDREIVRAVYLSMNLIGQFVVVPLSFATLITGLIESLGTQWGLFRHYWVLVKFTLTVGATILLLLHQFTAVAGVARRVSETSVDSLPDVGRLGTQLIFDAGLAVIVLLIATVLSIYKPWGRTSYGARIYDEQRSIALNARTMVTGARPATKWNWLYVLLIVSLIAVIVILHITGVIGAH